MPKRKLFRGRDRKRLQECLRTIEIIERRDGKVGPVANGQSSRVVAVFNAPTFNVNLPGALTQVKNRLNHLLNEVV